MKIYLVSLWLLLAVTLFCSSGTALALQRSQEEPVCFDVSKLRAKECQQTDDSLHPDGEWRHFRTLVAVAEELQSGEQFTEALLVYRRARQCAPDAVARKDMADNVSQLTVSDEGLLDHGIEQAFLKVEAYVRDGRVPQGCSNVWIDIYQKEMFPSLEIPLALLRILKACSITADKQELAEMIAIKESWHSIDDVAATFARFSELSLRQSVRSPVCFTTEEFE